MSILTRRRAIIGGIALVFGVGTYAYLGRDPGTARYFAVDGIALRGADPVAYFTQGKDVIGVPDHAFDWAGVTWHFASAAHRDAFMTDPQAYAPQYGGYCAWAVAAKQQLFSTQPANWSLRDGKLYLNYSDGVQDTWNADPAGFIQQADAAWPQVSKQLD